VEQGTHAQLLVAGGLYARLYTRRFAEESADLADPLMVGTAADA